ncbi:Sperm flagellar 2, putative [Babesia ovata]|uniref:Sperm flagellar 2, putative n=1 Tax=Babesia ovata TaxID=189622 RepID=A0A2H6KHZ9_9APIC|nr:Sperm flagellar 2, putative [Babesia ovata]GBE62618.1 Sperm flagellar 2, putative [Babesia ovata]
MRIAEVDIEQKIIFKVDAQTGEPIDDTDIDRCHHVTPENYAEYRIDPCTGDSYKTLKEIKLINTSNGKFQVIEHLLLSLQNGSKDHILYSVLYDTTNKAIIAMKRYVEYVDGSYGCDGMDYKLFDRPITSSNVASVFLGFKNEWHAPTLHPKHAGNVTTDGTDAYSVAVMPFGTLNRPSNGLNAVYYLLNGIKRTLVIPKLQSITGINLLSEDASSYVAAHLENETHHITVVYQLGIPGSTSPEAIIVRFEVTKTCINLRASGQNNFMHLASVPVCKTDTRVGSETQCVIHQTRLEDKSKGKAALYTFMYDAKMRHLTGVMHQITMNENGNVINAVEEDTFHKSANYTTKINMDINRNGMVKLSHMYAGYVSKCVHGSKVRAMILPHGIKNQEQSYTNRFLYRGIPLVEIYMETEDGISLVNRVSPPAVTKEAGDGVELIHITYWLKLLEYNTPHKITLSFECKQVISQSGGKKTEITLLNKYQRYRMDIDAFIIDASVWAEDTESFGGKCIVGVGEEGLYILMSRIIRNKGDATTGHFYKFLYDTKNAGFFCKSVPIRAVEQKPNKSCRWVRAGDDKSYTYSLGGSKLIEQEVSTMRL